MSRSSRPSTAKFQRSKKQMKRLKGGFLPVGEYPIRVG